MNTPRSFRSTKAVPPTIRNPRERRELLVSVSIVLALQLAIAAALLVAAFQTYRMWRHGVSYIPPAVARNVPLFFLLGVVIALFAASRSMRRARSIARASIESPPEE